MKRKMVYLTLIAGTVLLGTVTWNFAARGAYESAEYSVIESDGEFEIREYPDLMLVTTESRVSAQGRDGSFMRLFRYISGANEQEQKVAMTTPVFMKQRDGESRGQMAFVLPKEVASSGVPQPASSDVMIRKREGGRFAVIRFSGVLDEKQAGVAERKLRRWLSSKQMNAGDSVEAAGYDPPFVPGALRRNEVLIRLDSPAVQESTEQLSVSEPADTPSS